MDDQELQNLALLQTEDFLQSNQRSLRGYPSMSFPKGVVTTQLGNKLIYAEWDYNKDQLTLEFESLFASIIGNTINYKYFFLKVYI